MHLFCECQIIILFWSNVSDWISSTSHINIVIDKQHMLIGFKNEDRFFDEIYALLSCAKFLVYRGKYSESKPDKLQYFNLINLVKKFEFINCEAK